MVAMMAVLVGCNEIKFSGLLNISEAITFAQKGNSVVVTPGQFQTKASIGQSGQKKQIKMEIGNANPPTKVEISFDKNIEIGEQFNLAAAQIGQNSDLAGVMKTNVQNSPEYSGTESCTYQYPQTVCRSKSVNEEVTGMNADLAELAQNPAYERTTPEASNPAPVDTEKQYNGQMPPPYHTPVCNTIWVNRPGTMYVRYYVETTLRDITANFVQNGKTLGTYTGHASDGRTVYTYQSQCR